MITEIFGFGLSLIHSLLKVCLLTRAPLLQLQLESLTSAFADVNRHAVMHYTGCRQWAEQ
jgi:hypothetical protein